MIGPDASISIALLISITSILLAIVNSVRSSRKDQQASVEMEIKRQQAENARQMDIEKNFVKINVKLDDFCDTSKKLMEENKEKSNQLKHVTERLAIITERCDNHEKRITALERGKNEGA